MGKFSDKILNGDFPNRKVKRKIRKEALKTMGGRTPKERFKNYFTNQNGYYAVKEMLANYLMIIFGILTLAALIVVLCNLNTLSLATMLNNPLFITLVCGFGLFGCAVIAKIKYRRQRFKCFTSDGAYTKYVFWKDDVTNPINKKRDRVFK